MSTTAGTTTSTTARALLAVPVLLPSWAAVSVLLAVLPAGTGGVVRAVNAVLFLTAAPGCALAFLLARRLPAAVLLVVALATSLTVLLLSSQLLLILGIWAAWRVAALVAAVTIALVVTGVRTSSEVDL